MKQNVYTPIQQVRDEVPIRATCFHPSGEAYIVGTNSRAVKICKYPDSVTRSDLNNISHLTRISSGTNDTTFTNSISQPEITFTCLHVHCGSVYCGAFNEAGDLLATGSNDQSVHVIQYNSDKHIPEGKEFHLSIHSGTVRDVSFMHGVNSNLVISAGAGDNEINVTDCNSMKVSQVLRGHEAAIMSVRCFNTSSENTFATGSLDGTIRLWDLRSNEYVKCITPHDHHVYNVGGGDCGKIAKLEADDEDKNKLANLSLGCDSEQAKAKIINLDNGGGADDGHDDDDDDDEKENPKPEQVEGEEQGKRGNSIGVIRIDPTDRLLVSGHKDGTCVLFDIRGNRVMQTMKPHDDEIRTLNFSPNAYYLLSGSYDRRVKLWDLQGDLSNHLPGVELLELDDKVVQTAWHPVDYNFVTTCAKGTATLWAIPDFETWISSPLPLTSTTTATRTTTDNNNK